MKIFRTIMKCMFWLLIIALLFAPLVLIFQISREEMKEYTTPEVPRLQETSIGDVVQAIRMDISEYVTISGGFTSSTYEYIELDYKSPNSIRWTVGVGDEVQEGQVMGTYKGKEVISSLTGIIAEINTYSADAYLRVQLLDPVELNCCVDDRVLSVLRRSENLSTDRGEVVMLVYTSRQKNDDGTTNVRLLIQSDRYAFGQQVEDLNILTGRVYSKALVLPADCVYQKETGEGNPWYARKVAENGIFLAEVEVQIGYSNGDLVCVAGISEGEWFDSGYKAIVGE